MVYPPKKVAATEVSVQHEARDTRPLALKHFPSKVIASAVRRAVTLPMVPWHVRCQHGFVAHRNLCENVVLADSHARALGFHSSASAAPVAIACDIEAAFPSCSRVWMMRSFAGAGAPAGLISILVALHRDTYAVQCINGFMTPVFCMLSGILQGCPLASVCFLVLFSPHVALLAVYAHSL